MNEESDILSWQFTKGTSIDNVRSLLRALNTRSISNGEKIHCIMVDNCCSIRAKLQDIFGKNTVIKLDLFHAIQRIIKQIPKRQANAAL